MSDEKRPYTAMLDYDEAEAWLEAYPRHSDVDRADRPKPPRVEEPKWGESVRAHTVNRPEPRIYVRFAELRDARWTDGYRFWGWGELIDPEPVQ